MLFQIENEYFITYYASNWNTSSKPSYREISPMQVLPMQGPAVYPKWIPNKNKLLCLNTCGHFLTVKSDITESQMNCAFEMVEQAILIYLNLFSA